MTRCCMWYRREGAIIWQPYLGFMNMTKEKADETYNKWVWYNLGYFEIRVRPVGVNPNTDW